MWKALTVLSRCATTMVVRPGIKVSSVFCTTRSDVESSADVASSNSRIWYAAGPMCQVLGKPGLSSGNVNDMSHVAILTKKTGG
jgi:hypothetical protein